MENIIMHCANCGREINNEEALYISGSEKPYCDDCVKECDHCHDLELLNEMTEVQDGNYVCQNCLDCLYIRCCICEEYVMRIDASLETAQDGSLCWVCENCRDENAFECADCQNDYIEIGSGAHTNEDDDRLCDGCYEEYNRVIRPYSYKPAPIFFPEESPEPFFGIELEVDSKEYVNDAEIAKKVKSILGDYAYIKHDGSLNYGFEIVTHPATVEYHTVTMADKWQKAMKYMIENDLRSNDVRTCGLHIHVTTAAIERKDASIIGKIMLAMNEFWPSFVKFSRRTEEQLNQWAKRYRCSKPEKEDDLKTIKDCAKEEYNRYMALNLRNRQTIEFRLFNGSLNWRTFAATIQFVETIIKNLTAMSFSEIQAMTWEEITKSDFRELNAYLAKRDLGGIAEVEQRDDEPDTKELRTLQVGDVVTVNPTALPYSHRSEVENEHPCVVRFDGCKVLVEYVNFHKWMHTGDTGDEGLGGGHYWWVDKNDIDFVLHDPTAETMEAPQIGDVVRIMSHNAPPYDNESVTPLYAYAKIVDFNTDWDERCVPCRLRTTARIYKLEFTNPDGTKYHIRCFRDEFIRDGHNS